MSDTNKERDGQSVAAIIHESNPTRLYATLHASVMKEFILEADRDETGDDWSICVTDEGGFRLYDGYWLNSSRKTISDVLVEAVHGSLLDQIERVPAEAKAISTPHPETPAPLRGEREAALLACIEALRSADSEMRDWNYKHPAKLQIINAIDKAKASLAAPVPQSAGVTDALARMLPIFDKLIKDAVFTGDKAGQVIADMNTLRAPHQPQPERLLSGEGYADEQPCRDCADFGPICPNSGKPCGGAK